MKSFRFIFTLQQERAKAIIRKAQWGSYSLVASGSAAGVLRLSDGCSAGLLNLRLFRIRPYRLGVYSCINKYR